MSENSVILLSLMFRSFETSNSIVSYQYLLWFFWSVLCWHIVYYWCKRSSRGWWLMLEAVRTCWVILYYMTRVILMDGRWDILDRYHIMYMFLHQWLLMANFSGLQCLFRTPLNNYDAIILLHRDKLPYPQRLLFPSELNQGWVGNEYFLSFIFHQYT